MVKVTLKDGSIKEFIPGTTIKEIAESLGSGLAKSAIAGNMNGRVRDLSYKIEEDCNLNIITFDGDEGKKIFRHTSAHILAQAVKRLFPYTKLTIGPSIENGFYYDFDSDRTFSAEDFEAIEKEMKFRKFFVAFRYFHFLSNMHLIRIEA